MPEDNQLNTDTPNGEGVNNVESNSLTLEQLNEKLGTKYPDLGKALEGLKETRNYVGKAGTVEKENEELKKALNGNSGEFITKAQYEQDLFYSKHSDLEPYKDIINARAKELNIRPADAVNNDPSLKQTLEKLRGFDKTEGAKSVLMSNSRLGQVDDKMGKAHEAMKAGDTRTASNNAVGAVMELLS